MSFEFGYPVEFHWEDFNYPSCTNEDFPSEVEEWEQMCRGEKCVDSLKQWLSQSGAACTSHSELLRVLSDEDALREIGAKSLNALLKQVCLSPQQVSEIKLLKRRLRKRLAKRCWDRNERVREGRDREVLGKLMLEKEKLRCEKQQLIQEINELIKKMDE